ncbi:MAG: MBL fold metallo-hydrolase [Candidatus Lokiarchaeota archaeon]|nr:MBL fold metallo-hydrolase [Candidatus Lokiarchaeota archaeon]
MRIVFLGTAASTSTANARLQSIFLQHDDGSAALFDAGEDVQRAFEDAKIKLNKPLAIFITHMHGDHVIGLPGLLFRFGSSNRTQDVEIYGPRGLFFYLLAHRLTVGLVTGYAIRVTEIDLVARELCSYPALDESFTLENIESRIVKNKIVNRVIKRAMNFQIEALEADHTTPQGFTFIFQELPRPGKFNPERAISLKIPRGRAWGLMQEGNVITLKDGRIIDPLKEGIVGGPRRGRIVILSGDTRPTETLLKYIKEHEVDLLVHEATFTSDLHELAVDRKHTTVEEACNLAKEGMVHMLALTHFSIRYIDNLNEIEKRANEIFKGTIIARDNLVIDLKN